MARVTPVLVIAMMLICAVPVVCADAEEEVQDAPDELLVDYGNGAFDWYVIPAGMDSYRQVFDAVLGPAVVYDGSRVLGVGDVAEVTIGENYNQQTCSWRIYWWNSVEWEFLTQDADERYVDGHIALGFYPVDSVRPVSNPEYREVWTCFQGDSASSGVSRSFGPEKVATPLEWAMTYPGPVDSNILYADGMIYHTVAGKYGAVGMDALAWVKCLDPVNKKVMWSQPFSRSDRIEITTPVIVGDMLIVTSGNWHVYCLDRFTGEPIAELAPVGEEGDMCSGSKLASYIPRKDDSFANKDKDLIESGVSNAVYENGILYLCTSDGYVRSFSVDRENGFQSIWARCPSPEHRGTFYFQPPVLGDSGGTRCVLSGNYVGSLFCIRADTGAEIWTRSVEDTGGNRVGAISSISMCSGDRALVTYSNGKMNSSSGGVLMLDMSDGSTIWQHDFLCGSPTVHGDKFYVYLTARSGDEVTDSQSGKKVPLRTGYCAFWLQDPELNDCTLLWNRPTDALCKGGMTYCNGNLYSMDYSPGTEGATGGNVWSLEADTGEIAWRVAVSPYNGNAYSMCAPTVVDGKVIVGNDYGAVYVLSEMSGSENGLTADIDYQSQGLRHWSWVLTFIIIAATLLAAVVLYTRW